MNDSISKKFYAIDKILETVSSHMEGLTSAMKNQLRFTLVEKGSTPAGRFIFTDGSGYPPTVLFLVAVP
jgi:hypothetical protein